MDSRPEQRDSLVAQAFTGSAEEPSPLWDTVPACGVIQALALPGLQRVKTLESAEEAKLLGLQ